MDQTMVIDSFDKEYDFLSNFYECPVTYKGITYRSSEAAFQAQKTTDVYIQLNKFSNVTASEAKKQGRRIELRSDWEDIKVAEMRAIVLQKFLQNRDIEIKLLDTGCTPLIEGNWWKDTFWGVYNGKGRNMLGTILMEIRDYIMHLRCAQQIQMYQVSDKEEIQKSIIGSWIESPVDSYIPDCCKRCPNHIINGGSGICNCALPYLTNTSNRSVDPISYSYTSTSKIY